MRHYLTVLVALLSTLTTYAEEKPLLVYSRTWNAIGESRYQPDGTYSTILAKLGETFTVKSSSEPLTEAALQGVKLLIVANPSEKAVGSHPAPRHLESADRALLLKWIHAGGGLIIMGNQENHNLEIAKTNLLLAECGMTWENRYTDIKAYDIPAATPVVGGLRWGFYTGNAIVLNAQHPAQPLALVTNDPSQPNIHGPRSVPAVLMATATPGAGRVVSLTDAGFVSNSVLAGQGIRNIVIPGEQNLAIMLRLAHWAAQVPAKN